MSFFFPVENHCQKDTFLFSEFLALSELWIKQLSIFQVSQCHQSSVADIFFHTVNKAMNFKSIPFQIILAGYKLHNLLPTNAAKVLHVQLANPLSNCIFISIFHEHFIRYSLTLSNKSLCQGLQMFWVGFWLGFVFWFWFVCFGSFFFSDSCLFCLRLCNF